MALNMFNAFHQEEIKRQSEMGDGYRFLIFKPFEEMPFEELNNELKYFSLSVRRQDGGRYPPKTIYDIMTMLNFHLNNDRNKTVNIFTSDTFKESVRAMNTLMKEPAEAGVKQRDLKGEVLGIKTCEFKLG